MGTPSVMEIIEDRAHKDQAHRRLFVRDVPYDTPRETVEKYFLKYGEIEECVLIMDRATGRSKGFGFIVFKEMAAAYAAIEDTNKEIDGRRVQCNLASVRGDKPQQSGGGGFSQSASGGGQVAVNPNENNRVFFKGLNYSTTPDYLRSLCARVGMVTNVQMKFDHATGRSNGMATIEFRTPQEAHEAVRSLSREIDGRQVLIQLSTPN